MNTINFFDLKEEDLQVLNPYNFDDAIKRLTNLTLEEVTDDLKYFQKKEFEFRAYEEEVSYSLKNIKFITSSKIDENENEYYILENLGEYLVKNADFDGDLNKENKTHKKIELEIKNGEKGKKQLLLIIYVDPEKIAKNIFKNFITKSKFEKAKELRENFLKRININGKTNCRLTIKIEQKYINKIYCSYNEGKYYFDLQSPPLFRTNFFIHEKKDDEEINDMKKNDEKKYSDENCIFPFRNFVDEFANLEYRHFIIMIEKELDMETPCDDNENNFDSNIELNNSLENLYKNKDGKIENDKYVKLRLDVKQRDKNLRDLSYYFNYNENKEIKVKLSDLFFFKEDKDKDNEEENIKKEEKDDANENKESQVIKLFYQILALVSECILSYKNASKLLENLLFNNKYRDDIFESCRHEVFPKFFNLTLNKILDKYQNSLAEKSLKEFEEEMKNIFQLLYAQYENVGMDEIWKPSKNKILKRIQRCIITPTYILFTPYVLDQGNRVLREYIKSTNDTMLCTFKMDSLGEDRWNNDILVEYIKFILSEGFTIGEKKFRFFNYSQSQFRNMSCWLSINPEKVIEKLGDFSKIKPVCKYAARISQTLTTTIKTIKIQKDKIKSINDIKDDKKLYTFSDGVGKISRILAKQIADEYLKLDYVPSCFQGRFMGCKGVWTTMWDDNSGNIYYRPSQKKFDMLDDKNNFYYFELCDYSRYIQSYLNRQVILLLNALGIKDKIFEDKLFNYQRKLENQNFVLSLVHYPEWYKIFNKMYSCGINRANDRLLNSLIESNLDILYSDIKKKARIYIEESAYVKGILDEFGILEYGEAFLHIKRDNFDLILDKPCVIAKCPCYHPGDLRKLNFKKYNKDNESTKKYEVFNRYENVIIFPAKGKRPHPNECSGSDLDGDDYFVFYDSDLIPEKTVEPMDYQGSKNKNLKDGPYTLNDVIEYFAEYTNYNNLGLISNAHLALSDKEKEGVNSEIAKTLAKKFSLAVDAPKTGDKIELSKDEEPKEYPHFMEKNKNKSYHSKNILGKLFDKSEEMTHKREKDKYNNNILSFYDTDLKLEGWENFAFLALIYYRDYFNEFVSMLKKNEIKCETILLTGNNIDNETSLFQKKKNNYDLREKLGFEMHSLFINNQKSFNNAIVEFFINENKKNKNNINEKDLFNISLMFKRNFHLFASASYMISYNLLEDVVNKKINNEPVINSYSKKYNSLIKDNLVTNDNIESIGEISEYESLNIGKDYYECLEVNYADNYEQIYKQTNLIEKIIDDKRKDMDNFIKELKRISIPKQAKEENQYRILSFAWCFAGNILANIKYIKSKTL